MASGRQLVAHPTHDVHVGEVIQLHGMPDAELLLAFLGTQAVEIVADLGFSAGRQGEQQQDIDMLGHVFGPFRQIQADVTSLVGIQYSAWDRRRQVCFATSSCYDLMCINFANYVLMCPGTPATLRLFL